MSRTSAIKSSARLRDARERAVGALIALGATRRSVQLRSWRRALPSFLAALQAGAGDGASRATLTLIEESGELRRHGGACSDGVARTPSRPDSCSAPSCSATASAGHLPNGCWQPPETS
jgi:hypothetical protein